MLTERLPYAKGSTRVHSSDLNGSPASQLLPFYRQRN